jgi:hypothetical protein
MNKLTMAALAALLMATPVVAAHAYPDAETQDSIDWANTVAKANAVRLGQVQTQNQGDVAAVKANQANDAVLAPAAKSQGQAANTSFPAHYDSVQDIRNDN